MGYFRISAEWINAILPATSSSEAAVFSGQIPCSIGWNITDGAPTVLNAGELVIGLCVYTCLLRGQFIALARFFLSIG